VCLFLFCFFTLHLAEKLEALQAEQAMREEQMLREEEMAPGNGNETNQDLTPEMDLDMDEEERRRLVCIGLICFPTQHPHTS
jgi:hypothetical protein